MTNTDALGTFVLVVDDDDDLRDTISELLEARGYEVGRASDGIAALEFLRANASRPDLILLDLMMPRMNGWELRAALLADTELAKVPVVVMTASRNLDDHPVPASTVLLKPVTIAELIAAVETHRTRATPLSSAGG